MANVWDDGQMAPPAHPSSSFKVLKTSTCAYKFGDIPAICSLWLHAQFLNFFLTFFHAKTSAV